MVDEVVFQNCDAEIQKYDTLSVIQKSASATGQIGSRVGHLSSGANEVDSDHHSPLVSQESIQVAVTLPSSRLL